MTGTKSPRNDFVLVSCKHDANFDIRAGLTSSRSHVNGALESLSTRRFCQHGRQPEVSRAVIDGE